MGNHFLLGLHDQRPKYLQHRSLYSALILHLHAYRYILVAALCIHDMPRQKYPDIRLRGGIHGKTSKSVSS